MTDIRAYWLTETFSTIKIIFKNRFNYYSTIQQQMLTILLPYVNIHTYIRVYRNLLNNTETEKVALNTFRNINADEYVKQWTINGMNKFIRICVCVRVYVCMYVCMCVCVYPWVCIWSHKKRQGYRNRIIPRIIIKKIQVKLKNQIKRKQSKAKSSLNLFY